MKRAKETIIKVFKFSKEHLLIISFTLGVIIIMLVLQGILGKIDGDFWLSLIPNVLADMLSIIITTYIISKLLKKSEEKKEKIEKEMERRKELLNKQIEEKRELEKLYMMLGKKYNVLTTKIADEFIHFVTKEPAKLNQGNGLLRFINSVEDISFNIDKYVKNDFAQIGVKVIIVAKGTQNVNFSFIEETWSFHKYCHRFKSEIKKSLDEFISRYISILPTDLRERVFRVDELIMDGIFTTLYDYGFENDVLDNTDIVINVGDFQKVFSKLGHEIIGLLEYFKELE